MVKVHKGNCSEDQKKPIARVALELKKSLSRMIHSLKQLDVNSLFCFQEKIYILQTPDLCKKIIALYHDTKIAKYSRRQKTLELVSYSYQWPQISRYIGQYISIYNLYLCTKVIRHPLVEELYLLPILEARQDILSMDFVVELFKSSRYNAVMTVVDFVLKRVHFIPMHTTVTIERVTRLFLHHM